MSTLQIASHYLPSPQHAEPVILVCTIIGPLAVSATAARLWARWRYVGLKLDDWFMFVAALFFIVYCTTVTIAAKNVETNHQISLSNLKIAIDMLNVAEMFYILTLMVLKISIAIFYLRIVQSRAQKVVIYTTVLCSTLFSVAMFFFAVFQCGIYDGAFDFLFKRLTNSCASDSSALGMTYTHAVITTLTDWTFLLMPIWLLHKSLMSKRDKSIVGLFLAFASISGIASIIRFPSIHTLAVPKVEFFALAKNIAIWSALEPGIGIIAGCLVVMRPLFRRTRSRRRRSVYEDMERRVAGAGARRPNLSEISITTIESIVEEISPEKGPSDSAFLDPPDQVDQFPKPSKVNKMFTSSRKDAREPALPMSFFASAIQRSRSRSMSISMSRSSLRSRSRSRSRSRKSLRSRGTNAGTNDIMDDMLPQLPKDCPPMPALPKKAHQIPAATARRNLFAGRRTSQGPTLPLHLFESSL